ncbi:hypothetical protein vseg_006690 [Gypsophila vaccaria]
MGKSIPIPTSGMRKFSRIISSDRIKMPPKQHQQQQQQINSKQKHGVDIGEMGVKGGENKLGRGTRVSLSIAVKDCVRRWFGDTLKEARNGDTSMQVLVAQMYNSGYGVTKDLLKGNAWITRASKGRSSAWRVSNKQPGYNASDSDSEDLEDARS